MDRAEKEASLAEINSRWIRDCNIGLRETATQPVPGTGNPDADIMFIGEAPGKDEDLQGKPFVGAAGKFLNEMLGAVGITRDNVYITNVVKYRPPENRDPTPEEVATSWPWLKEQIELIDPALIILLGRHALGRFFPDERISAVHGKVLKRAAEKLGVRHFYALYHPAAALYNGSMRSVLMDDFKKIPKIIEMIKSDTLSVTKKRSAPKTTPAEPSQPITPLPPPEKRAQDHLF